MEFAKIGTLILNIFDKENIEALEFVKELCRDDTIKTRFQGIMVGLSNPQNEFFNHSFLVKHNDVFIGYINISDFNTEEKSIYLRAAITQNKRGLSYGKTLLSEITEYVFKKYPQVENIRLKIANDNKASLMTSNSCGYEWLKDDFYIKYNPYITTNKKIK